MILTGSEIEREWAMGRITIDPFVPEHVNPNSYNFRLGRTLRVYRDSPLDVRSPNTFDEIEIPDEGFILEPGRLYLAHTMEVLGSDHYAPTFSARSSVARLGMFINLSASLGDIGYKGQWTLQLYTLNRIRVYPGINIGQMMWWRPQGEIVLYDGKYQGAAGPRSSDIHVDFDRQLARQRFPGLGGTVDPHQVGPKFAALAGCSRAFRVPAAFCVPAVEFTEALAPGQVTALADAFADLRATVGAFFTESVSRIESIGRAVRVPERTRALLRVRLRDVFGDVEGRRFAVRSSGLSEDTGASSLAGVHHSLLDVGGGADEVLAAIEQCWSSYYEAPAVAARVRAGDHSPAPRLAVIVQEMVDARFAGVAFTGLDGQDPDASDVEIIEYVTGLADKLVAGVETPTRVTSATLSDRVTSATLSDDDEPADDEPGEEPSRRVLAEVVELVRALRVQRGHHVDVEWAADERGVHLIQVRPLTATANLPQRADHPVAHAVDLYFDDVPAGFNLGAVADVYGGYVAKRGPAYRLARQHRVATGAGWVLQFNGRGLHDPHTAAALAATIGAGTASECVLDLGETLRQIVVPKPDVLPCLAELTAATPDEELHAAVVREFIRGELGVISRLAGDGLIVEYSTAGLMALNRGTTGGATVVVADLDRPLDDPGNVRADLDADLDADSDADSDAKVLLPHLAELAGLTAAMQARYGAVTLEWVYAAGRPHFVDYSVLGSDEVSVSASGAVLISPGTARGRLLRLDEDELLARLSIGPAVSINRTSDVSEYDGLARILDKVASLDERPIIHASRPYAVLSVLIGHVAGFVFDHGSTLGHLAILLREAGVPAVAAAGLGGQGEAVISDGAVTVVGHQGDES